MTGALRGWVGDTSVAAIDHRRLTHYPDAATVLVFRTTADRRSDLNVVGPRTRASYHAAKDIPLCVRVRIVPGRAQALLGVPVSELADRIVPLSELWGEPGRRLADELVGRRPDQVLDLMETALRTRLAATPAGDLSRADLLRAAIADLSAGAERPTVVSIAQRLGVSERHLRNVFANGVGISLRKFARIQRVRTVLARTGEHRLAELAQGAGYYDQSHMTAEFRDLMGVPPGAFIAGRRPAALPC